MVNHVITIDHNIIIIMPMRTKKYRIDINFYTLYKCIDV